MGNITIHDLARLAETSVSTVSRALSGKPGISRSMRKRIEDLAAQLDYQPNNMARNLALQKSHFLGFIASELLNPFYVQYIRLVEQGCRERDYQVLLADSQKSVAKEADNINIMLAHRAEGLLLFPVSDWVGNEELDHLMRLRLKKVPLVVVGKLPNYPFDYVVTEEVESARQLTRHLLELGHRTFALLAMRWENRAAQERLLGIRLALREAGLDAGDGKADTNALRIVWREQVEDRETLRRWLLAKDRPTALIGISTADALPVFGMLLELGIRMPQDLSIASFDLSDWSDEIHPLLTVSYPDHDQVAQSALELLLERVDDLAHPPIRREIPQVLLPRESTGPAPRG